MPGKQASPAILSLQAATAFGALWLWLMLPAASALADVSFTQNTVESRYASNVFAAPCDLDEDGWMDMLATDRFVDEIVWLRNNGDASFTPHSIPQTSGYLTYPFVSDLDQDGDLDLLGATGEYSEVAWWENGGEEDFVLRHVGTIDGGHRTISLDIDQDGDLDIASCGLSAGGNKWFENDGSQSFTEHVLSSSRNSHCVDWADLDDDGDIDLVTTDIDAGLILWDNDGSQSFTHTTLPFLYAHWVVVDDLDEDGDSDLLAVSYDPSEVAWWENDGSGSFAKHSISTTLGGPLIVDVGDLDEDGDTDVAVAAINASDVCWWENDGSESFTEHRLTGGTYLNATSVQVADLDGDSDLDLVCSGEVQPCVRWFESDIVTMRFGPSFFTGIAPLETALWDSSTSRYTITGRSWDVDADGNADTTGQSPYWTFDSPGLYSIELAVSMGERTGRALLPECLTVFETGSAVRFDGSDASVECLESPANGLSGAFTLEAWIRPYGWGGFPMGSYGFGRVLSKGNVSLELTGTHPLRSNHSVYVELTHDGGAVSGAFTPEDAITLDEWQHVAVTYDGAGSVRAWIDGVEQAVGYTVAPAGGLGDDAPMTIGNIAGLLNRGFEGEIDEVRLWNMARGEADIVACKDHLLSGNESGLIGYWRFDEGNGSLAEDSTVSDADGNVNGPEWVQGRLINPTGVDDVWDPPSDNAGEARIAAAPNPFAGSTRVSFELASPSYVTVTVYNVAGRALRELAGRRMDSGLHTFVWDGRDGGGRRVASGIYYCRVAGDTEAALGKIVLLR